MPAALARVDVSASPAQEWAKSVAGVERVPAYALFRAFGGERSEFPALSTGEAVAAGLAKLVGADLDLAPARRFGAFADGVAAVGAGGGANVSALEVAEWLFWRGTSDGKLQTTVVLYDPPAGAGGGAGDALRAAFAAVSRDLLRMANLRFAHVGDAPDVLRDFELDAAAPTLVLYAEHDEGRHVYAGPPDAAALRAWVLRHDTPLVTDVWHKTLHGMRARVRTFALFFVDEPQAEHFASMQRLKAGLRAAIAPLVADGTLRRGEFTLAVADGKKYRSWRAELGLPADGPLPALGIEHVAAQARTAAPDFSEAAAAGMPTDEASLRVYKFPTMRSFMISVSELCSGLPFTVISSMGHCSGVLPHCARSS